MRRNVALLGKYYLIVAAGLLSNASYGQDKIYTSAEPKDGKVVEITADKVKYKNLQNPGPVYSVSREKVLFIFNSAGNYYILDDGGSEEKAAQFLQAGRSYPSTDVIYNMDGSRIPCEVENEDNAAVYYVAKGGKGKADKSNIAIIIFKNGQHKMFASDLAKVADVLRKGQGANPGAAQAKATTPPPTNIITAEKPVSPPSNVIVPEREVAREKPAPSNSGKYVQTSNGETSRSTEPSAPAPEQSAREKSKNMMVEELGVDFKEYEKKALQKTKELSDYIKVLCDKNTEYERAEKAIDQACLLFVNEDATVSVSSVSRQNVVRYKIRDYLKKLKLVKYGRVEIEWTNIQYVSKLRKGPDGNYYGVITFEQVFKGYKDNELVYSDVTRKNIEVVLRTYKKSVEGRTLSSWDVMLSDIGVVETKQS